MSMSKAPDSARSLTRAQELLERAESCAESSAESSAEQIAAEAG
jgi:hypothetical protein